MVKRGEDIDKKPLPELTQRLDRQFGKTDSRPSRVVGPDHLRGSANARLGFRKIQVQV